MSPAASSPRPIRIDPQAGTVAVIDQRRLPHERVEIALDTVEACIAAIRTLAVRGAPLIGVTGACGVALAAAASPSPDSMMAAAARIRSARPTAVNLAWAVERALAAALAEPDPGRRAAAGFAAALRLAEEEAEKCRRIGEHGLPLIAEISRRKNRAPVQILTHCNAGWLACVEHGTATAPIYAAFAAGIDLHVWVDETRPLNQGARLTAWELGEAGVPHTVIADNSGGHLMQHGRVDLVIVGSDRTTASGDVANKIGTYLKALAAHDNGVPFYVALPSSTFDWTMRDGLAEIPIEERDPEEVRRVEGWDGRGLARVRVCPEASPAANFAFDVTPARLVTGLITERGVCRAAAEEIRRLFPDKAS